MDNKRYWKKPLTLHELLEEAQNIDEYGIIPEGIAFQPPTNATLDVTDDDSGAEETVTVDNLPGSLLNSEAELVFKKNYDDISEDEAESSDDDIPLSSHMKYKKKRKHDNWIQGDIMDTLPIWNDEVTTKNNWSPLDIFYFFFDEELWDMLTSYTNLYAEQHNKTGDVTKDEMKCFFGVLIYSGYCAVSRRSLYWENSSDGNHRLVCEAISRNRFDFIM